MNSFKTNKGTELPILKLKGKDYLEVKYRLVWFREEKPLWAISTSFHTLTENIAIAKAEIFDENGRLVSTGHKTESPKGFDDYIEKAESGAIGRALAHIGYGTQFAPELEEGERIVDSPAQRPAALKAVPGFVENKEEDFGNFQITFGKKYLNTRLKDIPKEEAESYIAFLEKAAVEKKRNPGPEVQALKIAAKQYYGGGQ